VLVRGGTLRMPTILDEYTRECQALGADRALRAADVLHWLQRAIANTGHPRISAKTTARSSSPQRFNAGRRPTGLNPPTSTLPALGKMASSNRFTAAFATSTSTASSSGRSQRCA
jgi:hypothetical protein